MAIANPVSIDELINNYDGKDVIYMLSPEGWGFEKIAAFEKALNAREFRAHSNVRYRVMPHGMEIKNLDTTQPFLAKVIVRCAYCGQHGARGCDCLKCGAPIG
jgi:hypothetical protein